MSGSGKPSKPSTGTRQQQRATASASQPHADEEVTATMLREILESFKSEICHRGDRGWLDHFSFSAIFLCLTKLYSCQMVFD